MKKISNPLQACNDIFLKPNQVFATLLEKQNWAWLPFAVVITMAILPSYYYFNFVDFNWYIELIINTQYQDVSPSEQDMFRNNMDLPQVLTFTVVGSTLGYILINGILATYLNIMTRIDEENVNGFADWYGFTWWVSLPVIFSSLFSMVMILLSDSPQLSPTALGVTSVAYWFNVPMDSQWFNLAQGIRLESFWIMYLIAVGINQWTRININRIYFISILPYLLIWTLWGAYIALS